MTTTVVLSEESLSLTKVAGGAAEAKFREFMEKLVLNACDPRIPHGKRSLKLTLTFKPITRHEVRILVGGRPYLAVKKPVESSCSLGQTSGQLYIKEVQEVVEEEKEEEFGWDKVTCFPTLGSISGGAILARFRIALEEVVANIHDPNTEIDASRSITIAFYLNVDPNRTFLHGTFAVTRTLAPLENVPISFSLGYSEESISVRERTQGELF